LKIEGSSSSNNTCSALLSCSVSDTVILSLSESLIYATPTLSDVRGFLSRIKPPLENEKNAFCSVNELANVLFSVSAKISDTQNANYNA